MGWGRAWPRWPHGEVAGPDFRVLRDKGDDDMD